MKKLILITTLIATTLLSFGDKPKEEWEKWEFSTEWRKAETTIFWVKEPPTEDNNLQPSFDSAWFTDWYSAYGGEDDPINRDGYHPKGFTPKENPFYVAIPYNDLHSGERKESAKHLPWFKLMKNEVSVIKNCWVVIRYKDKECYAQIQDVGPIHHDYFRYIYANKHDIEGGGGPLLNVSPAVRDFLGLRGGEITEWRFATLTDTKKVKQKDDWKVASLRDKEVKEEPAKIDWRSVTEGKGLPKGDWNKIVTKTGARWKQK